MSEERRREPRLAISVPVTWRMVRLERVEEGREGTMVDVSTNGCCVEPRELGGVGLGAVVEIEVSTDAGVTTRRGLVVADPTRDQRLHLALRAATGDEQDLVTLLT